MTNQTEKEQVNPEQVEQDINTSGTEQSPEPVIETVEEEIVQIDPLATAQARIAELEAYIEQADAREQDIALRARAEVENIRRRAEQDVEKAHKFALEKFSKDLLSVVDNLERGIQAFEGADESAKPLLTGVEMTHKELVSVLARFNVEAVGVVGEAFNPELHQAISMQPAEGIEPNHISVVLQKGYTLQGRVLRPAMVMVAA